MRTRKQYIAYFRDQILPIIQKHEKDSGNGIDNPLRAEDWNNDIDQLIKGGQLPRCAANWSNPYDRRK